LAHEMRKIPGERRERDPRTTPIVPPAGRGDGRL
jgi:hypothetical protein